MSRLPDRAAIRPALRRAAPWLLAALAGVLLFALFGTVPSRLERVGEDAAAWGLPGLPDHSQALAEAEAVWSERHPWGGAAAAAGAAETAAAAAAAVPVPVAIVSTAAGHEAVFVLPGSAEIRVRAGGSLPDGGRVEQVDALVVTWIDGQGQRQEQRLLADTPRQAGTVVPQH